MSNTGYAPFVPVPLSGDTARTRDLKLQNDGELFFDSLAILIVYGTEVSQQGSLISLGYGTMLFKNDITFHNGGTFDAGSGVMHFQGVTWKNNSGSAFTPGTSTVILEGTSNQNIVADSSLILQFYNLQILTQDTVSITGSVTVQNDCYVAAGCTLNIPGGSSFSVNGMFISDGVIIGGGSVTSPLPVQLSSFVVTANGFSAVLQWRTETELNNYGFEIERRGITGGEAWRTVGFIEGAGTTAAPHEYSFVDRGLPPGRYAYRLKQINLDASSEYFDAAEIEVGLAPMTLSLGQNYPNPFNPATTIEFTFPNAGRAILKVYNIVGQEVATLFDREAEAGLSYQSTFNAASLPSGLYFARLNFGGQTLLKKMMLVK